MSDRRDAERGLSMLELMIASSGLVIIAAAIAIGSRSVFSAWGNSVTTTHVERRSASVLDKIVADLEDADLATIADPLDPPTGSSTITFRRQVGSTGGATQLGPEITIAWSADPQDPTDDADNDGDGLIDEGRVVRSVAAGQTTVLAENVTRLLGGETDASGDENGNGLEEELGLSFDLVARKLTVRVTLARPGGGEVVERTATTAIQLRE